MELRFGEPTENRVRHTGESETTRRAHRWLARFAPLLEETPLPTADSCRRRLQLIELLSPEALIILGDLEESTAEEDQELRETLKAARQELLAREREVREQLALFAPGDPDGKVNLASIRSRLAENAARREVEEVAPGLSDRHLELETAPASPSSAWMTGIFAFGWTSFTAVHATFMIGGFARAFGPIALGLLAFYAIFFAAGGAMAWSAWRSSCRETVTLTGRRLTLRRFNRFWNWEETYEAAPGAEVHLASMPVKQSGTAGQELALTVIGGKEIRFASNRPLGTLRALQEQINHHLAVA